MLTTDDLIKLQKILKYEIRDALTGIYEVIQSKADKKDINDMKDILIRHENYLKSEQKFIIEHLDGNTKGIEKLQKGLSYLTNQIENRTHAND